MSSYYSILELQNIGINLPSNPQNIFISKEVKFYNVKNITFNNHIRIDDFCILSGNVEIGSYVHIGAWCSLSGGEVGIEIHNFSGLSQRVSIFTSSDDYSGKTLTNPTIPMKFKRTTSNRIVIKKHCIVGAGSIILPNSGGLEVGVSVGAMSLVTKPTIEWGIYFGIPAKRISNRSKELLEVEKSFLEEVGI